jgi:hypothetical protein
MIRMGNLLSRRSRLESTVCKARFVHWLWSETDCEIVIVDKPFTMTSEEADKVIKVAEEKGLIVTCFQNRRWVRRLILVPCRCTRH